MYSNTINIFIFISILFITSGSKTADGSGSICNSTIEPHLYLLASNYYC